MIIKVQVDGIEYEVEIEEESSNPIIARIGDDSFEVWPESDEIETSMPTSTQTLPSLNGLQTNQEESIITSPLPGIVSKVLVQADQAIESGESLLVIEAMKMNNTIRANRSGVIKQIHVEKGSFVKHHQALIEFVD